MKSDDLISRSALLEQFGKCEFLFGCMVHVIIKEAPAVDAEPVRHGRWTEPYPYDIWDTYRCSVCGRDASKPTIYCPNCGVKMDATT